MILTLAIPVHNDRKHLVQLLRRVAGLGCVAHVVVVDDGSETPLEAGDLCAASGLDCGCLTLFRHPAPKGPGAARNRALAAVKTDHMLFLDADDLPTRELPDLLRDLDGRQFDFCIFQHHDTRMEKEHTWGQTPHDQTLWRAAGTDLGALQPVGPAAAAHLARTANYPWNKIYRTAFLRDNGIGCSEILLHEDVELHWRSFVDAGTILASDRVGVIHFVHPGGGRLTNRTGPERLDLFEPLGRIAADIEARIEAGTETGAGDGFALAFHGFAIGLFDWIAGNLEAAHHDRFAALVRGFLGDHVPPGLLDRIRAEAPARTGRVLERAGLG